MPYVIGLNRSKIKQRNKDRLEILKTENAKKEKQLKDLKLDSFIKNTLKKYNKPKPKKKRLSDVIKFPEINLI